MKEDTSYRCIGGTTYFKISPTFCKHVLGLSEKERKTTNKVRLTIEGEPGSGVITLKVEK